MKKLNSKPESKGKLLPLDAEQQKAILGGSSPRPPRSNINARPKRSR